MALPLAQLQRQQGFSVDSPLPSPALRPAVKPMAEQDDGLAARLRRGTVKAHEEVMQPAIVGKLVSGQLPRDIHLRYLMMLYSIYSALEQGLAHHASHPLLSTTYDPALLSRADSLELDCAYYTEDVNWTTSGRSKIWDDVRQEDGPLGVYVDRLRELGKEGGDPTLLLAHSYVRYLGDLSGGQTIARTIRKAYSLPETGEGSAFYEFFLPPTSGFSTAPSSATGLPVRAGPAETKEIKAWFRAGLDDAGAQMSEEQRLAVIAEARYAFELNIGVFKSFERTLANHEAERIAPATAAVAQKKAGAVEVRSERTSRWTLVAVGLALVLSTFIALREWSVVDLLP